jgi:ADP-ribose pyrophosphatase YjhB (NUDIX family)
MLRPYVSVLALVEESAEVLMIRRADSPYRRKWSIPGGHLEFGEGLEAAAVRETLEETGIEIRITGLIGFKNVITRESGGRYHDVLFCYAGVAKGGRLKKGKDVSEVAWKNPEMMTRKSMPTSLLSFLESRKGSGLSSLVSRPAKARVSSRL